jgi:hypothetical protein
VRDQPMLGARALSLRGPSALLAPLSRPVNGYPSFASLAVSRNTAFRAGDVSSPVSNHPPGFTHLILPAQHVSAPKNSGLSRAARHGEPLHHHSLRTAVGSVGSSRPSSRQRTSKSPLAVSGRRRRARAVCNPSAPSALRWSRGLRESADARAPRRGPATDDSDLPTGARRALFAERARPHVRGADRATRRGPGSNRTRFRELD